MIKKLLFFIVGVLVIFIFFSVMFNIFNNLPNIIAKQVERDIENTNPSGYGNYYNWVWSKDREFLYDIIYMNIFSPGMVSFSIKQANVESEAGDFILEASLNESELFKKIYNVKIMISSQVERERKIPLEYRELTITPEEKKTKEIVFSPDENIAEREGIKFKIPDRTYDPISVFFNFLSSDFQIGQTIVLDLLSKEEIYEFKATPKSFQNDIYVVEGEVFRQDKSSTHGARFTIWVLNGKIRVPLLVKVVSAAGPVYLRLKSVK